MNIWDFAVNEPFFALILGVAFFTITYWILRLVILDLPERIMFHREIMKHGWEIEDEDD